MNPENAYPLKYFLKKFFIVFSAIFASLIFLEAGIRFFYPQNIVPGIKTVNFGIPTSLKANFNHEFTNSFGIKYRIATNEKSFRRTIPTDYKKPANLFRILILGDSIAFGYSVGNNETFSFYLEQILNQANPEMKFEVLNSAVPSWGPLEYYFYLKNEGQKYNPDLVIFTFEDLDWINLNAKQIRFKNSKIKNTIKGNQVYLENPEIIPFDITSADLLRSKIVQTRLYDLLSSRSHFFNLLRRRLTEIFAPSGMNNSPINKTNELSFRDKKPDQWIIQENGNQKKISGSVDFKWIGTKIIIEKIQRHGENQGFKFLLFPMPDHFSVLEQSSPRSFLKDLTPQIPIFEPLEDVRLFHNNYSMPLFFPNDVHFLPSGHKLIAYLLFNFLATNNEFNSKIKKRLTPFSQNHIGKNILNSDSPIIDKVKLHPFWEFTQAMKDKNNRRFDAAKKKLQHYLKKEPDDYYAYLQMGFIFIKEKNYEEAAKYFYKAQQTNTKKHLKTKIQNLYNYASEFSKAWPFLQNGEFKRALPYLEKLSEQKSPFQAEANNMLSLHYLKQGNMKMALFYKNKGNKGFQNVLKQRLGLATGN